jgi:Prolyl oligopeptidase family
LGQVARREMETKELANSRELSIALASASRRQREANFEGSTVPRTCDPNGPRTLHWFVIAMNRYEHWIRRYEHRRWTTDDNRTVRPFEWGLEHIGADPAHDDPRRYLAEYASEAIARSHDWYAPAGVPDYRLDRENVLTFSSPVMSPWQENNIVHAQFFPAARTGPAVLLLSNWNAKWHGQVALCRWLQRIGISAMKMSLPYHDRRMAQGHERADQLVGPNIGLTLLANRQAVQDARASLTWLQLQGYDRLGILGTSIGSSVGYITLVHDKRVRAGGFFHVSTYFADVVSQGMTTNHVWEGLRHEVTVEELRRYWAPISPMPYVERGMGANRSTFMVYGKYDPTFLPELTQQMLQALRQHGADPRTMELPVGHYSLELPPFRHIAGYRMFMYFLEALG